MCDFRDYYADKFQPYKIEDGTLVAITDFNMSNIWKTVSDSHTLIKQSMQLHGRMQAKTIKLDQIQNNRLSTIIYFEICQKLR